MIHRAVSPLTCRKATDDDIKFKTGSYEGMFRPDRSIRISGTATNLKLLLWEQCNKITIYFIPINDEFFVHNFANEQVVFTFDDYDVEYMLQRR